MNTPVTSYAVDLLYEELPLFTRDEILAKLRDRCGAASAMDPGAGGGLNFFFPDLRVPFKEGTAPVQMAMTINRGPNSVLAGLGSLLLCVTVLGIPAAIYFGLGWTLVGQVCLLESLGGRAALRRSGWLVRSHRW